MAIWGFKKAWHSLKQHKPYGDMDIETGNYDYLKLSTERYIELGKIKEVTVDLFPSTDQLIKLKMKK